MFKPYKCLFTSEDEDEYEDMIMKSLKNHLPLKITHPVTEKQIGTYNSDPMKTGFKSLVRTGVLNSLKSLITLP